MRVHVLNDGHSAVAAWDRLNEGSMVATIGAGTYFRNVFL